MCLANDYFIPSFSTHTFWLSGTLTLLHSNNLPCTLGDGFIAQDIWIQNTARPQKQQAVALRVSADRSVINRFRIDAYQDILYTTHSVSFIGIPTSPTWSISSLVTQQWCSKTINWLLGNPRMANKTWLQPKFNKLESKLEDFDTELSDYSQL
ncbi:hypothetical protein NE237_033186 [Protea cynaroides]|uniref:Pectinesterase catalytic domain-containing protein n=1 Tax=Protea cynaroides TaxID=273540 RepID=A0A9Q0R473_9MAGN|nr:hypothetical protein NE237_033186 [Protea cynaroides]